MDLILRVMHLRLRVGVCGDKTIDMGSRQESHTRWIPHKHMEMRLDLGACSVERLTPAIFHKIIQTDMCLAVSFCITTCCKTVS